MRQFFFNFKNFFQPLNAAQKTLFGVFSTGLLLLIGMIFYWALTPSYSMLFGSLAPDAAHEIVEELKTMGVKYELQDDGRTIRVPSDRVYDLRLRFASSGLGGSEYKGYELFDQNALGMTDFMQRLNQKRALEGELARTINNLDQVDDSRIHIVLPDRSPFQQTAAEPTASVILNMKGGRSLGRDQVDGISSLIAGSVEGLTQENVVILDQRGNRISDNVSPEADIAGNSANVKLRKEMEAYLTDKGQTMLDRVLGPGNSILRVSTEHNFDKIIRESNIIDPESRIIISEERRSTRNAGTTSQPVQNEEGVEPFIANNTEDESTVQLRNYDVTKTVQQEEIGSGEITRISASLLLNHKLETSESGEQEYIPYSNQELNEIREVIAGALGISADRGDLVAITQMEFQDPFIEDDTAGWLPQAIPYSEIIKYLFLSIVLIVVSVMIYRMSKNFSIDYDPLIENGRDPQKDAIAGSRSGRELTEGSPEYEDEDDDQNDFYEQKMSKEARLKLKAAQYRTDEVNKFIESSPEQAARLVRTLINQNAIQ
ncbi:flagellar basal-body MS-ring/collar protein FliF [Rhodohalobacter mucosus]|uniref:Flagellar M-ring protein n=1 Tax=Rhodohalobacter mucosus TaxID=2079485 RepID=A0A316TSG8_9BACT|nr:flagellar basal-body MS-ring/collar protein FliF [Rhodohalobacter mucosus]PWN05172.1 flagellar M-ring protein FliF [Rhodohalobacter mucosus]